MQTWPVAGTAAHQEAALIPTARGRATVEPLARVLPPLLLVLLVGAAYGRFIDVYFTGTDTWPHIWTTRVSGPVDVWRIFTQPVMAGTPFTASLGLFYRPISSLSYALDYALWGMQAWGYHLTDVVLHAAATVAFYGLLRTLGLRRWSSALGAATFALHPAMASVVPSPPRRHDVIVAAAGFTALSLLVRAQRASGGRAVALAAPAFGLLVLAELAKEAGYVILALIPVVLAGGAYAQRLPPRRALRRAGALTAGAMGVSAVPFLVRLWVLGGMGGYHGQMPLLTNMDVALTDYLRTLFWPFEGAMRPGPRVWLAVVGGTVLATAPALASGSRVVRAAAGIGWAWLVGLWLFQGLTNSLAPYHTYVAIGSLGVIAAAALEAASRARADARNRPLRQRWLRFGQRVAPLAAAALVVLLQVGILRDSTLLTAYTEWQAAGQTQARYIAGLQPCLEQLPTGATVVVEEYPGRIDRGTRDSGLVTAGMMVDYGVASAIALTSNRTDLIILPGSSHDFADAPAGFRCTVTRYAQGAAWRLAAEPVD